MSASLATRPQHTPAQAKRAKKRNGSQGGNVLVYAIALAVVAITLGPVLYGVLGDSAPMRSWPRTPQGFPHRGCWITTQGYLRTRTSGSTR